MATRHSSRTRPSSRARSKPQRSPAPSAAESTVPKKPTRAVADAGVNRKEKPKPPDLGTILDHFSDSLALVETAYAVLNAAQENWDVDCCGSDISPAVLTLELGVKKLQGLRGDLDFAIVLAPRLR